MSRLRQSTALTAQGVNRPAGRALRYGRVQIAGLLWHLTGTPQSATVNTAFSAPLGLTATANDPTEPVDGGQVTFTPPGSGASASIATSPATIAGGTVSVLPQPTARQARPYNVIASTAGATSVNFSLTNEAVDLSTFYVKQTASGTMDCSSWADACALQTTLTDSGSGDQIWVAAGMYKPHASDRAISFNLRNGVEVYGGFDGVDDSFRRPQPCY